MQKKKLMTLQLHSTNFWEVHWALGQKLLLMNL